MKKQVFNPYLPSYEYIADGEPRIFGERLYIFGSHDRFNGSYYCENDYVCWSAPVDDLSDWRKEGIIFSMSQHPYETEKHMLFAPDVIMGPDKKYYLYYSVALTSVISVAVCDKPAGRYEYYGDVVYKNGERAGSRPGDFYQFDPAVFLDDDGRVYLYSGFCPQKERDEAGRIFAGAHVSELEPDMVTIKKGPDLVIPRNRKCPEGAEYFEAPSIRKICGIYYLVYSARDTGLHYCYSRFPDRDFAYGGVIHSASDIGLHGHTVERPAYPVGNTHGGIACIRGTYYIFDHRMSHNSFFCRQGVAEPIEIGTDGTISQVEATSCGLNGGPLKGRGKYPAYIACNLMVCTRNQMHKPCMTQDGGDRERGPGQYLKGMRNGCTVGYKYFDIRKIKEIRLRVRGTADGVIRVSVKERGEDIGAIPVRFKSADWLELVVPVTVKPGVHPIYLHYGGTGSFDLLCLELREW